MTWYREQAERPQPKKRGKKFRPKENPAPFVYHTPKWSKGIKPETELAYAEDTIRRAKNLYVSYQLPHPNPLNIDDKDLDPDAVAYWKYIFSLRGYTEDDAYRGSRGGRGRDQERTFENAQEVIIALECYLNWIRKHNFVKEFTRPDGEIGVMPIIPNQTNLAKWLGINYGAVTFVMKNDAEAQTQYKHILADCLSEGAMAGVYQTASTIFTLKNMCDWADKYEDRTTDRADDLGVEEAQELMKQLGYTRERATLSPPVIEGETDG